MKHFMLFEEFKKIDLDDYLIIPPEEEFFDIFKANKIPSRSQIDKLLFCEDTFGPLQKGDVLVYLGDAKRTFVVEDPANLVGKRIRNGKISSKNEEILGIVNYRRMMRSNDKRYVKARGKIQGKKFGF
jgi:hypothetical protein